MEVMLSARQQDFQLFIALGAPLKGVVGLRSGRWCHGPCTDERLRSCMLRRPPLDRLRSPSHILCIGRADELGVLSLGGDIPTSYMRWRERTPTSPVDHFTTKAPSTIEEVSEATELLYLTSMAPWNTNKVLPCFR